MSNSDAGSIQLRDDQIRRSLMSDRPGPCGEVRDCRSHWYQVVYAKATQMNPYEIVVLSASLAFISCAHTDPSLIGKFVGENYTSYQVDRYRIYLMDWNGFRTPEPCSQKKWVLIALEKNLLTGRDFWNGLRVPLDSSKVINDSLRFHRSKYPDDVYFFNESAGGSTFEIYSCGVGGIRHGIAFDTLRLKVEVDIGRPNDPPGQGPTWVFDLDFATPHGLTSDSCPDWDKLLYLISCKHVGFYA